MGQRVYCAIAIAADDDARMLCVHRRAIIMRARALETTSGGQSAPLTAVQVCVVVIMMSLRSSLRRNAS